MSSFTLLLRDVATTGRSYFSQYILLALMLPRCIQIQNICPHVRCNGNAEVWRLSIEPSLSYYYKYLFEVSEFGPIASWLLLYS